MTVQGFLANNVQFFVGPGNDLSGIGNKVQLAIKQTIVDVTTFGNLWRRIIGGLSQFSIKYDGVWRYDAGKGDDVLFGLFGYLNTMTAFTLNLLGSTTGAPTYTGNLAISDYTPSGDVKTALVFSATFEGDGMPIRGVHA